MGQCHLWQDDLQALNSKTVLSKANFLQESFQEYVHHILEHLNSDSLFFCYSKTNYSIFLKAPQKDSFVPEIGIGGSK